ncbi:Sec-independent protein translocase protein TatB [Luteimonas arsenica]|uniref:Sec-independent protein translocase protein TatB n=1 Tax=Luteimonas arsenica TaxID=1586242 RepID=UPI001054A97C|nr:Sec-independent protein translocase protein TatB [Luteimonas arsenica]
MFDLGFGELLLIALVALVVLGPERLPKAARFAGLWVRRARAQWYSVKSELERELAAEELKRNLDAARTAATDFERQARDAVNDLDASARKAEADTRSELRALREDLEGVSPGTAGETDADAAIDAADPPATAAGPASLDAPSDAGTPPPDQGDDDGRR